MEIPHAVNAVVARAPRAEFADTAVAEKKRMFLAPDADILIHIDNLRLHFAVEETE